MTERANRLHRIAAARGERSIKHPATQADQPTPLDWLFGCNGCKAWLDKDRRQDDEDLLSLDGGLDDEELPSDSEDNETSKWEKRRQERKAEKERYSAQQILSHGNMNDVHAAEDMHARRAAEQNTMRENSGVDKAQQPDTKAGELQPKDTRAEDEGGVSFEVGDAVGALHSGLQHDHGFREAISAVAKQQHIHDVPESSTVEVEEDGWEEEGEQKLPDPEQVPLQPELLVLRQRLFQGMPIKKYHNNSKNVLKSSAAMRVLYMEPGQEDRIHYATTLGSASSKTITLSSIHKVDLVNSKAGQKRISLGIDDAELAFEMASPAETASIGQAFQQIVDSHLNSLSKGMQATRL
jgi:hypothetical protein